MITGIDHIGIAVRSLDGAGHFFSGMLGLREEAREEVPDQKVRVAFYRIGPLSVEFLESTAPDGPIARFIEKRGPGLHHLALTTNDIRADLGRIKAAGGKLIDEEPRRGAHGCLIAFVHPSTTGGVLLELAQVEAHG